PPTSTRQWLTDGAELKVNVRDYRIRQHALTTMRAARSLTSTPSRPSWIFYAWQIKSGDGLVSRRLVRIRADFPFARPRLCLNQDRTTNFRLSEIIDPIGALDPKAATLTVKIAGDQLG